MRKHSVWDVILSSRRSNNRRSRKKSSKGDWQGVGDTVLFKPHKSGTLSIWRDTYKLKRQLREMERWLNQPPTEESWRSALMEKFRSAFFDVVDELKALLTELAFHVSTLVLVVVCNILWFAVLFWLIGVYLDW